MPRTKREENKSSKLSIQKRWCTGTKLKTIWKFQSTIQMLLNIQVLIAFLKMKEFLCKKSVLEQENVADTYDGPSYIIVDKNALCDIFKYTSFVVAATSQLLKLNLDYKYGFSHQLKTGLQNIF
ncbi:hypothetical protein TNIN_388151 [Trichonephila inaurata madagascariensis]|uniref:Uncharacterized protein n=1 Tax=Trichonephila inaurata madagascariensis TaxID=2747483 RepID=A0A8X7CS96_9ARAC|nr:hypothetical protein TNIN_388151 [Trichonephila inaurata madagascariensis]